MSASSFIPTPTNRQVAALINPRAPRQALALDGTTSGAQTLPADGSGDWAKFTWVNLVAAPSAGDFMLSPTSPASSGFMVKNGGRRLAVAKNGTGYIASSATDLPLGVWVFVGAVKSAGVVTYYLNAAADGTAADAYDYTGAATSTYGANAPAGSILGPLYALNRALTAAEVLALYQEGAPRAADFQPDGAGDKLTGDNSTFATGNGTWSVINGGSLSNASGKLVFSTGVPNQGAKFPTMRWRKGCRYRVRLTVSDFSGTTSRFEGPIPQGTVEINGNGTIDATFTATTDAAVAYFASNGGATSYKLDDAQVTAYGVVVAPDADAPGLGSIWKDVSGNGADLILPASGVSWVKPSAGENWLRAERSSNGYLVGDQITIPLNCIITEIWVKTTAASVALYSDSIPTDTLASFSPTSGVWFKYTGAITQSSTGKVYIALASAVLAQFKIKYVAN